MSELLKEIRQQSLTVSTEALNIGSAFSAIPTQFNQLIENVKKQFSFLSPNTLVVFQQLDARTATRHIERYDYVTIDRLFVFVPPGFDPDKAQKAGGMVKYAETLVLGAELVKEAVDTTLRPATQYLGKLVGDPSYILQVTRDITRDIPIAKTEGKIESYKDHIGKFFDLNRPAVEQTFGAVYKNNRQYIETLEHDTKLQDLMNSMKHKEVIALIESVVAYTDIVIETVKQSDSQEINSTVLRGLSEVLFQLALVAEFYGAFFQFALEFHHALEDTVKKLDKDLK